MSASADETVRLWHIESKQCLRVIQHKGQVTNAFIALIPSQLFADKLKPNIIMHRLQRFNDFTQSPEFHMEMSNEVDEFAPGYDGDLVHSISQMGFNKDSFTSNEESSCQKKHIDLLQRQNLKLFKLASEKVFNGIPEDINAESIPSLINIEKCLLDIESRNLEISSSLYVVKGDAPIPKELQLAEKNKKDKKKEKKKMKRNQQF